MCEVSGKFSGDCGLYTIHEKVTESERDSFAGDERLFQIRFLFCADAKQNSQALQDLSKGHSHQQTAYKKAKPSFSDSVDLRESKDEVDSHNVSWYSEVRKVQKESVREL